VYVQEHTTASEALVKTDESGKVRVLVVEDEPIAREILGDLLKMAGYDVLSVRTGEQALLTLVQERGRIDCLLTAVELPGLVDGWMVADEFRASDQAMPVVFAAKSRPNEGPWLEGAAFVARPVLPPAAVEAVKELTGRSGAALRSRRVPPRVVAESPVLQPMELPQAAAPGTLLKATG
jgi:CheY-like chemotaxis protein